MESESKIKVEEGPKTPEVDQESKAVQKNDQSTNGYNPELSNDSYDDDIYKSATSGFLWDHTYCKNAKILEAELPCQNIEPNNLNSSCTEAPQKQMTSTCFRQAGVPEDEAIAKISEVRQKRGKAQLSKPHRGTESAGGRSKEAISKDNEKLTMVGNESTIDVINASDLTNESTAISISSSSDDETDDESSDPNTPEDQQIATSNKDGATSNCKWIRHPDCKHSKEELKKIAQQIQTKRSREQFVYKTYCKGADTNDLLKGFLDMDANKPRIELRKMSKILPKTLRAEFYCKSMKRNNPHTLMRKYLSMPQNQQWLLCKRLKLSDTKLLSKLFQQPGQRPNNPVLRPLKEWFNIFLQEGSVDEAIGKVKKLILQGAVAKENTTGEIASNDIPSTNQSSGGAKYNAEITSCRTFGRKSKTRRNKKFQQLNEDQMKVYNSWLEQGLSHQDALTIVLRFPGERRPTTRENVCAWGKCDKHPQQKSKPPRTGAKAQPGANGTHPSAGSESKQFKKPIFDRIPVPSIIVDTSSPPVAELPLEHQASVPISGINTGISANPFTPHGSSLQSGIPRLATPSQTLAMGSQGPRVPQKSTFVDKPKPGQPKQDPSPAEILHLCIVPPGYPKECFSDEEFEAIENSIHIAISSISDERMKPVFKKQFRNNDKYEMVCQDQLARKWLLKYVACMFPVVPLKIIPAEPTKIKARAVLPLCKNDDTKKIFSFLARQNAELNVSKWEVVERSESGENTSLQLLVDEGSAKVLKNCSEVGFKMGIANINIEDSNQPSSKATSSKLGARQASGASGGASTSNSAVRSLQKEKLPSPVNKQGHESRDPCKYVGSRSKMPIDPSSKDLPKTLDQNSQEPHKPRYVDRRNSHEYKDSREQHESDPVECTPSSSKQNFQEPNMGMRSSGYTSCFETPDCTPLTEPWYNPYYNAPGIGPRYPHPPGMPPRFFHPPGMPPRFAHPPGMPPRFAHPPGMPPRFAHPPGMPPRFSHPPGMPPRFAHPPGMPPRFAHPPGMPPRFAHPPGMLPRFTHPPGMPLRYAHPLNMPPMSGQPPTDGFFIDRPKHLEQITERKASRSPSPDFAELLKSARSRLNLPDEPTDTSKPPKQAQAKQACSSEHPKQVCSQHPYNDAPSVKRTTDRPTNRNDPPKRISMSGGSIKRNHSPQGSSYLSGGSNERNHSPQSSTYFSGGSIKRTRSPQGSSYMSGGSVKRNHSPQGSSYLSSGFAKRKHSPKGSSYSSGGSIKRNRSPKGSSYLSSGSIKRNHSPQGSSYLSGGSTKRNHSPQGSSNLSGRSIKRNHSPKGSSYSSGGSIKRNHSLQGSSYLSRSGHRKRSHISPPPVRSTKSSRRN